MYIYITRNCASGGLRTSRKNRLGKVRSSSPGGYQEREALHLRLAAVLLLNCCFAGPWVAAVAPPFSSLFSFLTGPDSNPPCPFVVWVCA